MEKKKEEIGREKREERREKERERERDAYQNCVHLVTKKNYFKLLTVERTFPKLIKLISTVKINIKFHNQIIIWVVIQFLFKLN